MHNSQMQHIWSIVCQKGLVDRETNLLSVIDIFEQLTLPINDSTPFNGKDIVSVGFNYEVVTFWKRISGDKPIQGDVLIKIFSPNGKELANFPIKFEFPTNMKNFRAKIRMNILPVVDSGTYKFVVMQKEKNDYKTVAELPFEVTLIKANNLSNTKA